MFRNRGDPVHDVVLITIVACTVLTTIAVTRRASVSSNAHRVHRVETVSVWAIAISLWLWWMRGALAEHPQILVGYCVPVGIAIVEMVGTALTPGTCHVAERGASQMDTNSLVSIGFALASAAVISRSGTHLSGEESRQQRAAHLGTRMIAISLIICLAVLIPSVSRMNQRRVTLLQRVATTVSIGLLACSASLHLSRIAGAPESTQKPGSKRVVRK